MSVLSIFFTFVTLCVASSDCGVGTCGTQDAQSLLQSQSRGAKLHVHDSPLEKEDGVTDASFSQARDEVFSRGGVSVQGIEAHVEDGAGALSVRFHHQDKAYEFKMFPHNVYTDDAQVRLGGALVQVGPPRNYRVREEGKWASVTLHDDGTVQGLFQDGERVLQIAPASHHHGGDAIAALLESYEGEKPAHIVQWVESPKLGELSALQWRKPELAPHEGDHMPTDTSGDGARAEEIIAGTNTWGGVRWFGSSGCYAGDDTLHEMVVGIYSDYAAKQALGSEDNLRAALEAAVNQASFVYEMQMNFQLRIGDMAMETSDGDALGFGDCSEGSSNMMYRKLDLMNNAMDQRRVPQMAVNHIFTGCGQRWGILGVAYVGTLCHSTRDTGANKIHTSSPWLTFCHEVGHNLNARHSFDEGQGKTGGIMDYGDGKLNGHYQFNTQYRKSEVCGKLNSKVGNCNDKFRACA